MKGGLRRQLILVYGILMMVSLGVLGWIQQKGIPGTKLLGWEKLFMEQSESQIVRIADMKISQLGMMVETYQNSFLMFAHNKLVMDLACLETSAPAKERLGQYMQSFVQNNHFSSVRFVNQKSGLVIQSSQEDEIGKSFENGRALFQTVHIPDQVETGAFRSPNGEVLIQLAVLLKTKKTCNSGVLVAEYSPEAIFKQLLRIGRELGETGAIDVVDQEGRVIASSDQSILWETHLPPLYKMAGMGTEGLDIVALDFGQKAVCAFRHLRFKGDFGWGLVVRQSATELESPINQGSRLSIAMILIAILMALVAAYIIARRLSRPLNHLAQIANRFSEGDYSQRTHIEYSGDTGEVARAFDKMAEHLQHTMNELRKAKSDTEQANHQLQETMHELERLVDTDRLTSAWNRRYFDSMIERETRRSERYGLPLSLIIFDIDHFKRINDTYGHDTGDQILIEIVARVREQIRASDALVRWGGEEFVVVSSSTTLSGATALAEKIRLCIAKTPFAIVGKVTISLGVAQYKPGEIRREWVQRADKLLYLAKHKGRNRVVAGTGTADGHEPFRLEWQDRFLCGDLFIDNEHRELFEAINVLIQEINEGDEVAKTLRALPQMLQKLGKHYHDEEKLMEEIGFSDQVPHSQEHKRILREFSTIEEKIREGQMHPVEFVEFLIRQVAVGHIISYDLQFFPVLRRKKLAQKS